MRKQVLVFVAVCTTLATSTLDAAVGLELGTHEAARSARRHRADRLLLVVREDIRSRRSVSSNDELSGLEQQLARLLKAERQVTAVTSSEVRDVARQNRARRAMTTREAQGFLEQADAEAVLSLDYRRSRSGFSARLTLLDENSVLFQEMIQLREAPEFDETQPLDSEKQNSDEVDSKKKPASDGASKSPASLLPPGVKPPMKPGPSALKVTKRAQAGIPARTLPAGRTANRTPPFPVATAGITERRTERTADPESSEGGTPERDRSPRRSESEGEGRGPRRPDGNGRENGKRRNSEGEGQRRETETESEEADRPAPVDPRSLSQIARGIVGFASRNIGNKVGDGDCWDLAMEAMRAAGAEPPRGYTFGQEIPLNEIRFDEPGFYVTMGTPNHTAIVSSVGTRRTFILQQNFDGQRFVTTFDLDFNNMTRGQVQAYRPQPRGSVPVSSQTRRRN